MIHKITTTAITSLIVGLFFQCLVWLFDNPQELETKLNNKALLFFGIASALQIWTLIYLLLEPYYKNKEKYEK